MSRVLGLLFVLCLTWAVCNAASGTEFVYDLVPAAIAGGALALVRMHNARYHR